MKEDETILAITSKEEIEKVVLKLKIFSFKNLKKKRYYELSLLQKNTNEKELDEYFTKFDRIKLIFYRKRLSGYNNYDFHYEKDDGTYIVYSINLDKMPPELINAFTSDKNFKNFLRIISKRYDKTLE